MKKVNGMFLEMMYDENTGVYIVFDESYMFITNIIAWKNKQFQKPFIFNQNFNDKIALGSKSNLIIANLSSVYENDYFKLENLYFSKERASTLSLIKSSYLPFIKESAYFDEIYYNQP